MGNEASEYENVRDMSIKFSEPHFVIGQYKFDKYYDEL